MLALIILGAVGVYLFRLPRPLIPSNSGDVYIDMLRITQAGRSPDILITDYDKNAVIEYLRTCQIRRSHFFRNDTNTLSGIYFSMIVRYQDSSNTNTVWMLSLGESNDCHKIDDGIILSYKVVNPKEFVDTIISIVDPEGELQLEVPIA